MESVTFTFGNPCPRAKLLAGSYQCPCHGLHPKVRTAKAPAQPRVVPPREPRAPRTPRVIPLSSPQDQEGCRELYTQGVTILDLSKTFGASKNRVRNVLGDLVLAPTYLTADEKADIAQRFVDGQSVVSIAKSYGRDRWVIYRALGKKRSKTGEGKRCGSYLAGEDGGPHRCAINRESHPTVPHSGQWRDRADGGQYRVQWND